MTDNNDAFTDDAWNDDETDDGGPGEFVQHVEKIREQREQNDSKDETEESLDEAVERLSGRVYQVKYPDPADPENTEREKIIVDQIEPTAAGMVFYRTDREKAHVYPAPVEFEGMSDERIRSWVKGQRKVKKMLQPIADAFSS